MSTVVVLDNLSRFRSCVCLSDLAISARPSGGVDQEDRRIEFEAFESLLQRIDDYNAHSNRAAHNQHYVRRPRVGGRRLGESETGDI